MRIARETGTTPAQVALSWLADKPGVTAPIVGARTPKQLREILGAASLHLDAQARDALDKISEPQCGAYPYGAFGTGQRARTLEGGKPQLGMPPAFTKGSDAPPGRK